MRKLKTKDIPAFCRCIKDIGIKDEIKKIANDSDTAGDAFSKGFELIYNIFDLATEKDGERILFDFLADIYECSPVELSNMDISEFLAGLEQIAKENNLRDFFGAVTKLTMK